VNFKNYFSLRVGVHELPGGLGNEYIGEVIFLHIWQRQMMSNLEKVHPNLSGNQLSVFTNNKITEIIIKGPSKIKIIKRI